MPSLKNLIGQMGLSGGLDLVVTGPHSRWLELPEDERVYSPEAVDFIRDVLTRKYKRPRLGRFSASSMGMCQRRVLFGYAGAPALGEDPDVYDLMGLGEWGHLRWQAEGLSAGWMTEAELFVSDPELRIGGSIDGVLHDHSIFELKTVHPGRYTKVVTQKMEPLYDHLLQTEAYMMLSGMEQASIVYEDRGSGQFHEFRVASDPTIQKDLIGRIRLLNRYVDLDELPEMLADCEMRVGTIYRSCPYREYCPKATRVTTE